MAEVTLLPGQSVTIGPLAAETLFEVKTGVVDISTDGGATSIRRTEDQPITRSASLTVTVTNARQKRAIFVHEPI